MHPLRHRPALIAALLLVATGCRPPEQPLRDAWALWIEYRPDCSEARPGWETATPTVGWSRAIEALTAETLSTMEELLASAGDARHPAAAPLADLVAAARRICELRLGAPAAASVTGALVAARADLAEASSRLARELPLSEEEVYRRTSRYSNRLADAVTRGLRGFPATAAQPDEAQEGGDRSQPEWAREGAPIAETPLDGSSPLPPESPGGPDTGSASEVETAWIRIRAVSGESWADLRRRREAAAKRRLSDWRPRYREAFRPVEAVRRELSRALERESFDALGGLCARLGEVARSFPAAVVEEAPEAPVRAQLTAMLDGYAAAASACGEGRTVLAWTRLVAADRSWEQVVATVERLDSGLHVPDSLLRRSRLTAER